MKWRVWVGSGTSDADQAGLFHDTPQETETLPLHLCHDEIEFKRRGITNWECSEGLRVRRLLTGTYRLTGISVLQLFCGKQWKTTTQTCHFHIFVSGQSKFSSAVSLSCLANCLQAAASCFSFKYENDVSKNVECPLKDEGVWPVRSFLV